MNNRGEQERLGRCRWKAGGRGGAEKEEEREEDEKDGKEAEGGSGRRRMKNRWTNKWEGTCKKEAKGGKIKHLKKFCFGRAEEDEKRRGGGRRWEARSTKVPEGGGVWVWQRWADHNALQLDRVEWPHQVSRQVVRHGQYPATLSRED